MGIHNIISLRPRALTLRISPRDREAIENEIERLLAVLDDLDGDPDLEPEQDVDGAHDDGCGPVYINGHKHWGAELADMPERILPIVQLER